MDIIFHGVRGSTPVPLSNFQKYGGNTTCIEIRHPSFQIILDAGTGFQNVEILGDRPTFLLFSHFNYDHLQGLPFCPGLFDIPPKLHIHQPKIKPFLNREILLNVCSLKALGKTFWNFDFLQDFFIPKQEFYSISLGIFAAESPLFLTGSPTYGFLVPGWIWNFSVSVRYSSPCPVTSKFSIINLDSSEQ